MENLPLLDTETLIQGDDLKTCIHIGKTRYLTNRSCGIREQKYTSYKSGLDLCIQGVIGEWTALKLFDLPLDGLYNTRPNNYRNDRGDMIWNGCKIDVKTAEIHNHVYQIQVRADRISPDTGVYMLLTMTRTPYAKVSEEGETSYREDEVITVVYRGAISRQQLTQPDYLQYKRGYDRTTMQRFYVAGESDLVPLQDAVLAWQNNTVIPKSFRNPIPNPNPNGNTLSGKKRYLPQPTSVFSEFLSQS